MDGHAAADMGLSTSDLSDLVTSFNWVQAKAYSEILKRGKFSWNQVRVSATLCCRPQTVEWRGVRA
jgi:hypothetical protein